MFNNDCEDAPQLPSGEMDVDESHHEQSCTEEFVRLYYEKIDKQQHEQVAQFYLNDSLLVWNGERSIGNSAIQQLLSKLPRSKHVIGSLDMHLVADNVGRAKTFLVSTAGIVRFEGYSPRPFFQTFWTTLIGNKYKIKMGNYRFPDVRTS